MLFATKKPRIVLATDSLEPSGMGEHMVVLGTSLSDSWDVTISLMFEDRAYLLARAVQHGLAVKLCHSYGEFHDWLSRSDTDLLHIHAGIGWEGHDLAKTLKDIPIVRTEHLPYLLTEPSQQERFRSETKYLSHHIVVSSSSKDSYEPYIEPARLTVIENGIPPLFATLTREQAKRDLGLDDKIVLVTVARFSPQKDHSTLLKALPEVLSDVPGVVLLLVGSGEEETNAIKLAGDLGIEEHTRFLGQRADVSNIVNAADLFVLPSLFEGLPLAVLEAMSLGIPVVATRVAGSVDALGGNHEFFAEPGSPASLAAVIRMALADPDHRLQAGKMGWRRYQERFSAGRMATQTSKIYSRILKGRSQKDNVMQKTHLAFIGVGGIAQRHLDILADFSDVKLVGFADVDLERAQKSAIRFGARAFGNHRDMLDALQPDAVYVCIPPFAHGDIERELVERDIPFFVEKPVSIDIETATDIADAVTRKGLVTAVGYHWRYLDTVEEARKLLAENPAQLLSGYWLDSTPPPKWWWDETMSGGQMVEQATHLLDLIRFLSGEVSQVYGRVGYKERSEFPGFNGPTVTTANLTMKSGAVANVSSTCLLDWNHRVGLHIFADRLAIELTDKDIMVDVGQGRPVRGAEGDPVWREDRDFIDAVRGAENNIRCPYSEAVATHQLALAVISSARSGSPVRIEAPVEKMREPGPLRYEPKVEVPLQPLPPGHRMIRSLGVEAPGRAFYFDYEETPPIDGQARLETLYSGFSAGTELTFIKNTNPYFHSRFDADRGVFIKNEPGLQYPVPFLGYMEVARVAQSQTTALAEGQLVASTYGHKTGHTADPSQELLVKLPKVLDPILGVFVAQMGPIAANGILHADAEAFGSNVQHLGAGIAGRRIIVIGAGTVGMLIALFARELGASEVLVADPSEFRRSIAGKLEITGMSEDDVWEHAKSVWHNGAADRGADLVFQTRAHAKSLQTALKALRPQGTVVDLAFYQNGADYLRLGEEFHHSGLNIRCAQINRVPRGLAPHWNRQRLSNATLDLLSVQGERIRDHMITHIIPLEDAAEFVASLSCQRTEFLQIVFKVSE
ncbi:glycosyltransferase [Rhizobium sp. RM]|uniref:glycosyltransferase n=1 Tax=Rhizobium sp. RM TaxID=2748079 RepID=UPI001FF0143E|nr:glycosyltransferase [Rhizobium sp. RM]